MLKNGKDVHELNFREMTKEQLAEESLIDLAFAILEEKKVAIPFEELIKLIQGLNGLSNEEIKGRLVQFYTDMNIDGRFLLENDKGWGLREWYKVEQIEEETAPSVKIRKKKSKVSVDDEDLDIELDEELDFEEEFEEEFVEDEDFDVFVEEDEDEDEVEDLDEIDFEDEEVIDEIVEIDEDLGEDLIDEEEVFDEIDEEDIDEDEL